jgi:phosphoribosylformimino-5-aminoimidazole carboxamide ribotide isomerase
MLVIPAIDLLGGSVVRLYKGDKSKSTVYSQFPYMVAERWKNSGAQLLHVVDLDAAFGKGDNLKIISGLAMAGIPIQVGGGIRSLEKAAQLFDAGVERIVIGTKAVDGQFLESLVLKYKDKVAVGVDVVDGNVAISGWQEKTAYNFIEFVEYLVERGVRWIIYTDVSRDGTLSGVDVEGSSKLKMFDDVNFIISGGVGSSEDLLKIKEKLFFAKGVIVGKALYENKVDLAWAIKFLKDV